MVEIKEAIDAIIAAYEADNDRYIECADAPSPALWLEGEVPKILAKMLEEQGTNYESIEKGKRATAERELVARATNEIIKRYDEQHYGWLERYKSVSLVKLNIDEPTQLYRKWPEQEKAQPVYLEIDSRAAEWGYVPEPLAPVPQRIWSGRAYRVYFAEGIVPTARAANDLITAYEPEIRRVAAGIRERGEDGEYRGDLTADAKAALATLNDDIGHPDALAERDKLAEYAAEDWYSDARPLVLPTTTDEELLEMSARLRERLPETAVVKDLLPYLHELRGTGKNSISVEEAARKWGMTEVSVLKACSEGRIRGAYFGGHGAGWRIPLNAYRPRDRRADNPGTGKNYKMRKLMARLGENYVEGEIAPMQENGTEHMFDTELARNDTETQVNEVQFEDGNQSLEQPNDSMSDE